MHAVRHVVRTRWPGARRLCLTAALAEHWVLWLPPRRAALVWRPVAETAAGAPSALRASRGLPRLSVGIPLSCTNVAQVRGLLQGRGRARPGASASISMLCKRLRDRPGV